MQLEQVAKALKELGHPTRLSIYQLVVHAGRKGIPVGNIQQKLNIPSSTLSHHISNLTSANLIEQRREGRTLYCVAQYENLQTVIDFLQKKCCTGKC